METESGFEVVSNNKPPRAVLSEEFNQVIFQDIFDTYPNDSDIITTIKYPDNFIKSKKDKVLLFEVGWSSVNDYIYAADLKDNYVKLCGQAFPKDVKALYQLCYCVFDSRIVGVSKPFSFQSVREEELIEYSRNNEDSILSIKSRFAVLMDKYLMSLERNGTNHLQSNVINIENKQSSSLKQMNSSLDDFVTVFLSGNGSPKFQGSIEKDSPYAMIKTAKYNGDSTKDSGYVEPTTRSDLENEEFNGNCCIDDSLNDDLKLKSNSTESNGKLIINSKKANEKLQEDDTEYKVIEEKFDIKKALNNGELEKGGKGYEVNKKKVVLKKILSDDEELQQENTEREETNEEKLNVEKLSNNKELQEDGTEHEDVINEGKYATNKTPDDVETKVCAKRKGINSGRKYIIREISDNVGIQVNTIRKEINEGIIVREAMENVETQVVSKPQKVINKGRSIIYKTLIPATSSEIFIEASSVNVEEVDGFKDYKGGKFKEVDVLRITSKDGVNFSLTGPKIAEVWMKLIEDRLINKKQMNENHQATMNPVKSDQNADMSDNNKKLVMNQMIDKKYTNENDQATTDLVKSVQIADVSDTNKINRMVDEKQQNENDQATVDPVKSDQIAVRDNNKETGDKIVAKIMQAIHDERAKMQSDSTSGIDENMLRYKIAEKKEKIKKWKVEYLRERENNKFNAECYKSQIEKLTSLNRQLFDVVEQLKTDNTFWYIRDSYGGEKFLSMFTLNGVTSYSLQFPEGLVRGTEIIVEAITKGPKWFIIELVGTVKTYLDFVQRDTSKEFQFETEEKLVTMRIICREHCFEVFINDKISFYAMYKDDIKEITHANIMTNFQITKIFTRETVRTCNKCVDLEQRLQNTTLEYTNLLLKYDQKIKKEHVRIVKKIPREKRNGCNFGDDDVIN